MADVVDAAVSAANEAQKNNNKQEFLFQLPIFADIPSLGGKAVKAFLSICKEYEFTKGAIIAYQDSLAEGLYIVQTGQLESFKVSYTEKNEQVFARERLYSAGDRFRDMWLIEPELHGRLVRARKAGRLILIRHTAFVSFINTYPKALAAMYPHLSPACQSAVQRSRFQEYLQNVNRRTPELEAQEQEADEEHPQGAPPPDDAPFVPTKEQLNRFEKMGLLPGEYVEYDARRSKKILSFRTAILTITGGVLFTIMAALTLASGLGWMWAGIIGLGVAAIPLTQLGVYYINWRNCYFLITNRRIIRSELDVFRLSNNVEKIDIEKVQSVNILKPNFIANWLKIGTAAITTAAQSAVVLFDYIDSPKQVEKAINKINERQRQLGAGQRRQAMRRAIERHFDIHTPIAEVKPPPPPPKEKTWAQKLYGRFVRDDSDGVITYHKHPIALVRYIVWPTILLFTLMVTSYGMFFFAPEIFVIPAVSGVFIILLLADIAWFLWEVEDWRNDTFQITDRYIIDIDRLPLGFGENRKQAELSKVENVVTQQDGLLPNIFKYGSVQVETAGVDSNIVFENVREPGRIQNEIFAKRDAFISRQSQEEKAGRLDQNALLIEMYEEAREYGRIPRYQPLPPINDEENETA